MSVVTDAIIVFHPSASWSVPLNFMVMDGSRSRHTHWSQIQYCRTSRFQGVAVTVLMLRIGYTALYVPCHLHFQSCPCLVLSSPLLTELPLTLGLSDWLLSPWIRTVSSWFTNPQSSSVLNNTFSVKMAPGHPTEPLEWQNGTFPHRVILTKTHKWICSLQKVCTGSWLGPLVFLTMAAWLTLWMRLLTLSALLFSPMLVCRIIRFVTFQLYSLWFGIVLSWLF